MIPGEATFREICKAASVTDALAALADEQLRDLIAWLDEEKGEVANEMWAAATNEAKERFMKGEPQG